MSTISAGTTSTTTLIHSGDTTGSLVLKTNDTGSGGTTAVTIDTSQNVGIGTASPQTRLHAFSSATTTTVSIQGSLSAGANTPTLDFTGNNGGYSYGARIQAIRDTSLGGYALTFGTTANNAAEGSAPTERMRIDSSGNVGIGTSSPATILHVKAASPVFRQETTANVTTGGVASQETKDSSGAVVFTQGFAGLSNCYQFGTAFSNGFMRFLTGSAVEAMRIDSSGNLLVGTTSNSLSTKVFVSGSIGAQQTYGPMFVSNENNTDNVGRSSFNFQRGGTLVGQIVTTNSTCAYNSVSDYRLKENIAPMIGALGKVAQLKPCTFTWKSNSFIGQGFIAHELQEVVPDCVTGEKDAVDAEGNPQYQGIDTSFLVATLTAAIQELKALVDTQASTITQLQADVAALKGTS